MLNQSQNSPIEELLYEEESTTLDFKREEYKFSTAGDHQKSEILKDILAFSNAWRRIDAYILIGVEEVKGGRSTVLGIQDELDDAKLQQFVNSKTQRPIEFTYHTTLVDGIKVGVIKVPVQRRPFYLKKDYGKLKRHVVYIRRGSSTDEASPEEVRDMGKAEIQESQDIPALSFEFANTKSRSTLGTELSLHPVLLDIPPLREIPDFHDPREDTPLGIISASSMGCGYSRPEYYRELVTYYYIQKKSEKIAFLLRNDSSKTISDIRVELLVRKIDNNFSFFEASKYLRLPRSHSEPLAGIRSMPKLSTMTNRKSIEILDLGEYFRVEVPFEKVQPKQTVFSIEPIFIASNNSFSIGADVTIYADNVPIPIKQQLQISCEVSHEEGSLEHIQKIHQKYLETKHSLLTRRNHSL